MLKIFIITPDAQRFYGPSVCRHEGLNSPLLPLVSQQKETQICRYGKHQWAFRTERNVIPLFGKRYSTKPFTHCLFQKTYINPTRDSPMIRLSLVILYIQSRIVISILELNLKIRKCFTQLLQEMTTSSCCNKFFIERIQHILLLRRIELCTKLKFFNS